MKLWSWRWFDTPGRMAITYYRELTGSEFLERLQAWHESCAWHQNFGKDLKFVGVPSPRDIAEAAYGRQVEGKSGEKLRKATVERLLPCIIDGRPIPRDLVESTVRRSTNRLGLEKWEWEKNLGIACALFKGHHKQRSYQMALEHGRTSRDYVFGRLLAVAEHIERRALKLADEERDTSAAKLMQRFADHPIRHGGPSSFRWHLTRHDFAPSHQVFLSIWKNLSTESSARSTARIS